MKKLSDLSKDERSLLLYLECRAVDNSGVVQTAHMNDEDSAIAQRWKDEGFIRYGRIKFDLITKNGECMWVILSPNAFKLAHEERQARAGRTLADNEKIPDEQKIKPWVSTY